MLRQIGALAAAACVALPALAQQPAPSPLDTVRAGRFDNGKMWTFDQPPLQYFREAYGFAPDAAWFERARLGALRIPGCSASFVSPNGLVMTNHHCGRGPTERVMRTGENLLETGFMARALADERRVPEYYADMLVAITDVTAEVEAAAANAQTAAERASARQTASQAAVQRLQTARGAGYTVQVIPLYNGSKYSAYTFRRFDDVRLVMTPELQMGFFGGDPDNFTYPRYALDMTFFRVYDGGQPYRPQSYFRWSTAGAKEGDAVFVIGNPGATNRLEPVSLLEWRRDVQEKETLGYLRETMAALKAEYDRNPSPELLNQYFGLSNSEKAYTGRVKGLNDPYLMARRRAAEATYRTALAANADLTGRYGRTLDDLAALQTERRTLAPDVQAFVGFSPASPYTSATLRRAFLANVWLAQNRPAQVQQALLAVPTQPKELDRALLEARVRRLLAAYNGAVFAVEGSPAQTPAEQASYLVANSVFADSARTAAAVAAGAIPETDPALRYVRSFYDRFTAYQAAAAGFAGRQSELLADLGRARFGVYGYAEPPDATFSLRIADGVVAGYPYNGTQAPPFTTFYGLYDRNAAFALRQDGSTSTGDWALPARWRNRPATFDLATPMNFVSTNDIIGGNSGSPVLNKNLEVVGLVFDGNVESLPGSFIYAPETYNRTVSVDARGMLEALDEIYDLDRIARELTTGTLYRTEAEADRGPRAAPARTPARRTTAPARRN